MPTLEELAAEATKNAPVLNSEQDTEVVSEQGHEDSPELEIARKVARSMGWKPKDEWKGDPTKWEDADKFVEYIPEKYAAMKDRVKKTGQAAEAAIEAVRRQAIEDARKEIENARATGDVDAAVKAAEKMAELKPAPAPEALSWKERNTWFDTDQQAAALAVQIAGDAANRGIFDPAEQLKLVDEAMAALYPQYYPTKTAKVEESKAEVRQAAPSVQPGNRTGGTRQKEGWDSLPSDSRQALTPFVKQIMRDGKMDEKAAREKIAKSYYKDQN